MAEFEFDLRDVFRVLRRRKWVIFWSPILVGTLTYWLSAMPSPVYEAESLVKISRAAANMQALLIEALSWYPGDNIATQSQIITSQKIKARVALRLGEKHDEFREVRALLADGEEIDYDALEEKVRNSKQLVTLIDNIRVEAEKKGESDIVGIKSTGSSEDLAIDIANYTAEEFLDYNIAERNSQIREAVRFIQARIRETEQELNAAERKLEEFKREHTAILSLEHEDMAAARDEISGLQREIASLERGIKQLEQMPSVDQYFAFFPALTDARDPLVSQLEQQLLQRIAQIDELRTERSQLLSYQTGASMEIQQNVFKAQELEKRVKESIGGLIGRYRAIRDELIEERRALVARQDQLQDQLDEVPEVTRQLESLQRQVALRREALNLFQARLQDAEIQKAGEIKEVSIVQQANSASSLYVRSKFVNALLGLLIGAILGGVFAFVLESMDTSIGTIEDVERYVGLPVLGVIPHLDNATVREKVLVDEMGRDATREDIDLIATLCTHFAPRETVSEAFRSLRAHLDVLLKKNGWKTLLVTSSVLQEGKTSTASNLAVVFAQSGQRTLLIDADLRRPQVHKVFGLSNTPGLTEVLLKVTDWESAIRSIDDLILGKFGLKNSHVNPGLEYLFLLSSGRRVDNPAELLNLEKVSKILAEVRHRYDVIILDIAPVLPVAEAAQLASGIDATLIAYQIGRVGREAVNRTKSRLLDVGGNVIGLVMNDIEAASYYTRGYEYYGYKYKYEEVPPSKTSPGVLTRLKGGLSDFVSQRNRRKPSRTSQQPSREQSQEPQKPQGERTKTSSQSASSDRELEDIMKLTDEE
ncbi:polysaccharide biosynthesis tyrosine autokinase [Acidobacteria bacterium AH-259-L09]|nr:polysaccharide biosynthesis tyrosine autokinase [Acidobacteria bacterium AH-259-L09]